MGMTNHHRTWGRNPRLVGKNRENSSRWKDDEPDEGSGQAKAARYMNFPNSSRGRKILFLQHILPELLQGVPGHCAPERVVLARWCTGTFFDCGE
ncbi:hypothetical protein TNCV_1474141 [Trichonephila clavipes]|nr:hypothetical protein TNCV_1474141 [Trichonephila clavipes]